MIYLLRHGEIEGQEERRYIGQLDLPLSDIGRRQAHWWQRQLADITFDKILCSDLQRSQETARIISGSSTTGPHINTELRELNLGEWEGLAMDDVRSRMKSQWRQRGDRIETYRTPGGESFSDLQQRVIPVYKDLAKQIDGSALIVAHAGVNRVILCHLLGLPLGHLFRLGQDYGAMNIIASHKDPVQIVAMNLNPQVLHLNGLFPVNY